MDYEFLLDLGTIIRLNREFQNLSLSTLAEDANISVSQLSKIERRLETTTTEVYARLFEALSIKSNGVIERKEMYESWFDQLFNMIVRLEDDALINKEINKFCETLTEDFISIEYLLIKLIRNRIYTYDKEECSEVIESLSKIERSLNLKQKQLYYTFYALYHQDSGNVDAASYYFESALKLYPNPELKAMIGYYLAPIYRKKRQILKAHNLLMTSKEYFLYSGNFLRSILTDLMIAGLYASNREYETALELYYKCIGEFKRIDVDILSRASAYINVLYIHVLKDEYEEGNKVLESLPNDVEEYMTAHRIKHFFLYKAIIYFGLDLEDEAQKICKMFKAEYDKNRFIDNYLMYYGSLKSNKNVRIRYLRRIKSLIYKTKDLSELQFYFKLINKESINDKEDVEFNEIFMDYFSEKI